MGLFKVYVGVQKKNRIFLKGLVNNFVQKIKHFPCFYFGQNRQEKKKQNKILKSRKNCVFPKGLVYGYQK